MSDASAVNVFFTKKHCFRIVTVMRKTKMAFMLESELNKGKISQVDLAEKLEMSTAGISLWKSGKRPPPDPRDEKNLIIYRKLAGHFKITLSDAILNSLLTDVEISSGLSPAFMKGFYKRANEQRQEIVLHPAIERIGWNIKGCEYFLEILEKMLKEYIALTKKNWRPPKRPTSSFLGPPQKVS